MNVRRMTTAVLSSSACGSSRNCTTSSTTGRSDKSEAFKSHVSSGSSDNKKEINIRTKNSKSNIPLFMRTRLHHMDTLASHDESSTNDQAHRTTVGNESAQEEPNNDEALMSSAAPSVLSPSVLFRQYYRHYCKPPVAFWHIGDVVVPIMNGGTNVLVPACPRANHFFRDQASKQISSFIDDIGEIGNNTCRQYLRWMAQKRRLGAGCVPAWSPVTPATLDRPPILPPCPQGGHASPIEPRHDRGRPQTTERNYARRDDE